MSTRIVVRYVVTGGAMALLYAAALAAIVAGAGVPAALASPIATLVVVPPTYLGHRLYTFGSTNPVPAEFSAFVAVVATSTAVAAAVVLLLVDLLEIRPFIGGLVAAGVVPIGNFLLHSKWVFAKRV